MKSRRLLVSVVLVVVAGCSSTPTNPTITPPPVVDPGPAVNNTPPVIGIFTIQGTRTNEPPNFADASEPVPVSVVVTDAESQISDLKFTWYGDLGTFAGSGPNVTWTAPATVSGPTIVTLHVQVVETYTSQGRNFDNIVTGSTTVSLHDSVKEVGDMARQFLLDFSDSSLTEVPYIMRNFEPTCYGTAAETSQVADNRANFKIVEWRVDQPATTVQFGGICPYRFPQYPGDACAQIRSYWKSEAKRDIYDDSGNLYLRAGGTDVANGVDQVAAQYFKNQQRWRLCDSSWKSDNTLKAVIRGLIP